MTAVFRNPKIKPLFFRMEKGRKKKQEEKGDRNLISRALKEKVRKKTKNRKKTGKKNGKNERETKWKGKRIAGSTSKHLKNHLGGHTPSELLLRKSHLERGGVTGQRKTREVVGRSLTAELETSASKKILSFQKKKTNRSSTEENRKKNGGRDGGGE